MAENWTLAQAVRIIREGKNLEAIKDIGKRFPVAAILANGHVESLERLLCSVPEFITMRKVETVLAGSISDGESDGEPAGEPASQPSTPASTGGTDYESKTAKELAQLCADRKLEFAKSRVAEKKYLISVLTKADGAGATPAASKPASNDDDWGDEPTNPYEGKTAKELFTLCKERDIEVEPKKDVDHYTKLLKKADEKAAKEASKPAEPAKPASNDDDWDI